MYAYAYITGVRHMGRPSRRGERRAELLPIVARAFAELGYRRTTTSALAKRCGVQENVLYRLWPHKKAMFLASIGHVFQRSAAIWEDLLEAGARDGTAAERVIAYEAEHLGELGLHRILFAGLGETDDPEIRTHLKETYRRFQRWLRRRVEEYRGGRADRRPEASLVAWAAVGLGTVVTIGRELELLPASARKRLLAEVGRLLLEGRG